MCVKPDTSVLSLNVGQVPNKIGLFLFDYAPSHKKRPEDGLDTSLMNVGPGGKQPRMRDTLWDGQVQKMVNESGVPKGLKRCVCLLLFRSQSIFFPISSYFIPYVN